LSQKAPTEKLPLPSGELSVRKGDLILTSYSYGYVQDIKDYVYVMDWERWG
jgi:hypothetical protein